jgi:hypothetical protein
MSLFAKNVLTGFSRPAASATAVAVGSQKKKRLDMN